MAGNKQNHEKTDRDLDLILEKGIVTNPGYSLQEQMKILLSLAQEDKENGTLTPEEIILLQQKCQKDIESLQSEAQLEWRIFLSECQSPKADNNFSLTEVQKSMPQKETLLSRKFITIEKGQRLWDLVKTYYPEAKTDAQIVETLNALVLFQKNISLKNRLLQDTLGAGGVLGKDGVLGDKILIGDRLEIPAYTDLFPSK